MSGTASTGEFKGLLLAIQEGVPADVSSEVARRCIENKGPLHRWVRLGLSADLTNVNFMAVEAAMKISVNPYASERVKQTYFYPKEWQVPAVEVQCARLGEVFGSINLSHVEERFSGLVVPAGFDGIAVWPKLRHLGERWSISDPYGKGYGPIVEKVLGLIEHSRPFHNYRRGDLTDSYIRLETRVRQKLERVEVETKGDVNVLPISFGNLYAGYSTRNARETALRANQLPLGSGQSGCLLLTMPDRLADNSHLFIDCPADKYNWGADGRWSDCPYFNFHDGKLEFLARGADGAFGYYGSVVAFPPE